MSTSDKVLPCGLNAGQYGVSAPRPGETTTTLGLSDALAAARAGTPVLFVATDSAAIAAARQWLVAEFSGVPLYRLRTSRPDPVTVAAVDGADDALSRLPLTMAAAEDDSIDALEALVRRQVAECDPALVVVDDLGRVDVPGAASPFAATAEVARRLRSLAEECAVTILATARQAPFGASVGQADDLPTAQAG